MKRDSLAAAAHITGGGITDNLPRARSEGSGRFRRHKLMDGAPLCLNCRSLGNVPDYGLAPDF